MIKTGTGDTSFQARLWKSIKRREIPVSEWLRTRIFGLGLINFSLFVILNITGILLTFYYIPDTHAAYRTVKDLEFAISFGMVFRNMHRWAAFLMIISVFLHMCRVFFMAEYRSPRELNWVIGMVLFFLTLGAGLTGYILLWDQKAYWGMTIMSNVVDSVPFFGSKLKYLVLGGTIVDQNSLSRMYAMHVKVIPLIMGFLMVAHFWRIRADDSIAAAALKEKPQSTVPDSKPVGTAPPAPPTTWPTILMRELTKSLFALALIMAASILFNAPLEEAANPSVTPNPTKAIWFFVGMQELLSWGAALWCGIVVPNLVVIFLFLIPYIETGTTGTGVWLHPSRRLQNILFTAFVTIVIGLIIIGWFFRGPGWVFYWPWQPWPVGH